MKKQKLEPWLVLFHMPGMNARLFNNLIQVFHSPQAVLGTESGALKESGANQTLIDALASYRLRAKTSLLRRKVFLDMQWQEVADQYIFSRDSPQYPAFLKQIYDPPPLIYVKGNPKVISHPQLAIVGSRNPSPGGRKTARRLAWELSEKGLSICSGMAMGIDYESHMGALDNAGPTMAVLGTGIDRVYPEKNVHLAHLMTNRGAMLSEFPLGSGPRPFHFPQRNRIISGVSLGVLVVEAAMKSGSLITARCALEQGREVFAVPGSIYCATSRGTHHLIKQGAKLVEDIDDIFEELGALLEFQLLGIKRRPDKKEPVAIKLKNRNRSESGMDKADRLVLKAIGYEATSLDTLMSRTGLDIGGISAALTSLEMQGKIHNVVGGYTLSLQ